MAEGAKVLVLFKAEGGAPCLDGNPTKQLKFDPLKPFSAVVDYLKRKLKSQLESEQLFVYVHKFCPSLDEELGVIFEAYKDEMHSGKFCLTVSYAPMLMYG
ncbi:hypothetical protein BSKO_08978 [Bryopsis sp. KO-2023]|nr:hypothetical protein BSKO_08978 [Bryopsis sp. KO-2023]